jgi:hypothetical protein
MIGTVVQPFRWTPIPRTGMEVYSYSENRPTMVFEDDGDLVIMAPITTVIVRKGLE